jgi:hypothetical protein
MGLAVLMLLVEYEMTSEELRGILVTDEYKRDLEELSSYLASIKQERPIIYSLAKFLWKRRRDFQLEDKHRDLVVDDAHLEFKYNFDCDMARLEDELKKLGDKPLTAMRDDVQAWKKGKNWRVIPNIYEDMCMKRVRNRLADIFVWIICSRDLREVRQVRPAALKRICWWKEQCKWSETHPYSDLDYLTVADSLLDKLRAVRPFSVVKGEIVTNRDFPSTYHFRICEFSKRPEH